jgi:hypothetical protein
MIGMSRRNARSYKVNARYVKRIVRLFKENNNQAMSSQEIYEHLLLQKQKNLNRPYSLNPTPHGLRNILAKDKSFRRLKKHGYYNGSESKYKVALFELSGEYDE